MAEAATANAAALEPVSGMVAFGGRRHMPLTGRDTLLMAAVLNVR